MKICPNCGTTASDNETLCYECGTPLDEVESNEENDFDLAYQDDEESNGEI